jgi:predicted metal-dependent peptidase
MFEEAQVQCEPWHSHLRRFFTSLNARQYNWSRINKRHAVLFGSIAPDMRVEQMGEIVVGVDCSGSITPRQLGSMASHLSDICNECAPKKVTVMYFDSRVSHVDEYEGPIFDIKLVPHGGGGTDFRPVFDKTESEYPDAQVVIMMTDMYGPWGAGCSKEVVWVTQTETINPSFGEIIHADFNE